MLSKRAGQVVLGERLVGPLAGLVVFAACVAIWCLVGSWLVSHHRVTQTLQRWGHWLIPAIYIAIALYIFQREGALNYLR